MQAAASTPLHLLYRQRESSLILHDDLGRALALDLRLDDVATSQPQDLAKLTVKSGNGCRLAHKLDAQAATAIIAELSFQKNMGRGGRGRERMDATERRRLRALKRVKEQETVAEDESGERPVAPSIRSDDDSRIIELLSKNEDELLGFVAMVNKVYEQKLHKVAPFMTFVFVGMQSTGKSTIMERFMNAPLNIVQEGTGTRCPLDTTCIHDESCTEPVCELYGEDLLPHESGSNLSVNTVFASIVGLNKRLGEEDRFSTNPIRLHYRACNVQNMRFVDTPGIIETLSTGKDNREEIKSILVSEMSKENTKLCVLLEPKEFATNAIIRICDDTFGASREWMRNSIFLMTKYDKQLEDSRTGSKANKFFKEFLENGCVPFPTMTPTLPKEDLVAEELFAERRKLLDSADRFEKDKFKAWKEQHDMFKELNSDEDLDARVGGQIGFPLAKKKMREIMLEDTVKRLPEVIASLRSELDICRKELTVLKEKDRMTDPLELKVIVSDMLHSIEERLLAYLNGDLRSALHYPDRLQSLLDEIDVEEDSDWATKDLNFHSEKEEIWRNKIVEIDDYPPELMADAKFLGGKQVQRAISFFKYTTLDSLPDPYKLKEQVANITGYLNGGLNQEDWERAMVQITTVLMKDVSHPGVNYVVKHIGCILRRLFDIAIEDVKHGEELSSAYQHMPTAVEKYLKGEFDKMLWELLKVSADRIHCAVEPMYSTINPNLPNYHPCSHLKDGEQETFRRGDDGEFHSIQSQKEKVEANWMGWVQNRVRALTDGADHAKEFLKDEFQKKANSKKSFLPNERSSMITDSEVKMILHSSFEYLVALQEHILIDFEFQINHYLYLGFKKELSKSFKRVGSEADWETLVRRDPSVRQAIAVLEDQMTSLSESLSEVQKLNQKF